jgi:hypothetical protein
MTQEIYVIIEGTFEYNDSYVANNSGAISGYFTDKLLAEKVCEEMNKDCEEEYQHEDSHYVVISIKPDKKQEFCSDIGSDAT